MSIFARTLAAAVSATLLVLAPVACSAPTSPKGTSQAASTTGGEQSAVDALGLKRHYKDVVMGTEIQGRTLVVYVDVDNLNSMDEAAEDALRAQTLGQWKRIWLRAHPRGHGTLRLSLRDYYGNEVTGDSVRV